MKENSKMSVKRNEDGMPVAWELLHCGAHDLTIQWNPAPFVLSESHLEKIMEKYAEKGNKIPVDANHSSLELAKAFGVDKSDLKSVDPARAGKATLGFGELALRDHALWIENMKWNPVGEKLMKAGQYKYFSPVLKGLDHPENLRVTSVALTNEPRLNRLPELVASEVSNEVFPVFAGAEIDSEENQLNPNPKQKESNMDELKKCC